MYCCRECYYMDVFGSYTKLKLINCKHCGKEFKQKNVTQQYCSTDCYYNDFFGSYTPNEVKIVNNLIYRLDKKGRAVSTIKKICKYCKEEYIPHRKTQKYCCIGCSTLALHNSYKKHEIKKCEHCGNDFKANNNNKKYCNAECYNLAVHGSYKKNELINCKYCRKEFKSKTAKQRYCSVRCFYLDPHKKDVTINNVK